MINVFKLAKREQQFTHLNLIVCLSILFCLVSLYVLPAFADQPSITNLEQTQTTILQPVTAALNLQDQASAWGLKSEDYHHYLWLMNNTPSSHWYKQLDPAEVLALNAKDPTEMMQYAKIQAKNMHVRITRELAFDKIYRQAYLELYPHEKAIQSSRGYTNVGGLTLQAGDRIWLFTGTDTPLGTFVYQHLIALIQQTPHTTLDIYFVGKNINAQAIQQWAIGVGITPAMVNNQVTLNDGNDRFASMTQNNINLPYVGILHNQHFQPITLSSVL